MMTRTATARGAFTGVAGVKRLRKEDVHIYIQTQQTP